MFTRINAIEESAESDAESDAEEIFQ